MVARRGREFKGGHALRVKNREVNVMELPPATVRSTAVPWHVLPYCDDYLGTVRGRTRRTRWENAQCFARTSEKALEFLGLKRHPRKGQWLEPGQGPEHVKESVDHLGGGAQSRARDVCEVRIHVRLWIRTERISHAEALIQCPRR